MQQIRTKIVQNPSKVLPLIEEAFILAQQLEDTAQLAVVHVHFGLYFQRIGEHEQFRKHLGLAQQYYRQNEDWKGVVRTNNGFSTFEYYKGNYDEVLRLTKESLELALSIQYQSGIVRCYSMISTTLKVQGKFDEALTYLMQGLKIAEKIKDLEMEGSFYANLGIIYQNQGNEQEALHFFEKSLKKKRELGRPIEIAGGLNNLGGIYILLNDYDKALVYLGEALEVYEKYVPGTENEVIILNNMATLYAKQRNFKEALTLNQRALTLSRKLKTLTYEIKSLISLGMVYEEMRDYEQALNYLRLGEQLAETKGFRISLLQIYQSICKCYEGLKRYEQALVFYKKLLKTKDEQYSEEKGNAIAKLQVQYETAQKEKEIALQKLALEKKELELQRKKEVEQMNVQLEQMVEKRTQQLQIQNKQLKQYAFIVAHDLKEPLCNLSGVAALLNENYKHQLDATAQHFLQHIEDSTEYMNRLLEDLLIYATLSKEKESNLKEIGVLTTIQKVENSLKDEIAESQAKIAVEKMPNTMKISSKHLFLLFQNLLNNALQFHRKNVATLIQIQYYETESYHRFEVKDNGIGISPENQQKIFRIFHRLDKATFEGTGIGLAICEKIVQLYGGEIGVRSSINEGSVFYFSLPM